MFDRKPKKQKKASYEKALENQNKIQAPQSNSEISDSIEKNIEIINELFKDVDILITRYVTNNYDNSMRYCLVYCDGVVNSSVINESIIKPLMLFDAANITGNTIDNITQNIVMINETEKTVQFKQIIEAVTYGDTVLFAEGCSQALILNSKGFFTRAIAEPENEKSLTGPSEGFNESLIQNLSLIRRRIRTNDLKMKYKTFGRRTNTKACICYIDGLVKKEILEELNSRLDAIDIDAVLDTNYFTELIRDSNYSPFRTTGYTEKPDVVVGKLLEGRIAIFLDGTPTVLTIPYLFIENFQSSEDYYLNYYYVSFARFLRFLGFFLTIITPGLYISVEAFHHEMLPTPLLINIAAERSGVPLPAALEASILLLVFDILRETGVRMPTNIGQALSIVGALVIGQAAVEAKLVAAPMIIVVALTGITGLLVPKLNAPIIYSRIFLLILSSAFGFFGFTVGVSIIAIHILNLKSFNVPQVNATGYIYIKFDYIKDIFIRAPIGSMKKRPAMLAADDVRNATNNGGKNA